MIPLLVPEISPCDGFCDEEGEDEDEELGILGVRLNKWMQSSAYHAAHIRGSSNFFFENMSADVQRVAGPRQTNKHN